MATNDQLSDDPAPGGVIWIGGGLTCYADPVLLAMKHTVWIEDQITILKLCKDFAQALSSVLGILAKSMIVRRSILNTS